MFNILCVTHSVVASVTVPDPQSSDMRHIRWMMWTLHVSSRSSCRAGFDAGVFHRRWKVAHGSSWRQKVIKKLQRMETLRN